MINRGHVQVMVGWATTNIREGGVGRRTLPLSIVGRGESIPDLIERRCRPGADVLGAFDDVIVQVLRARDQRFGEFGSTYTIAVDPKRGLAYL